jgi:rhodanese-related sulfurtransferase
LGGALCGAFALMFHHYVVRIFKARSWLSRGAVLVDVDIAGEFARHHPRVAVSVPLEALAQRAHELGERSNPVVIFAHSWSRGARAVHLLRGVGFTEVMNAAGLETKEKLDAEAARRRCAQGGRPHRARSDALRRLTARRRQSSDRGSH